MEFKLSKYIVHTDILDEDAEKPNRILFSSRSGASFLIHEPDFKKLMNSNFLEINGTVLSKLIQYEILVPQEINEFKEVMAFNRAGIKDEKVLSSIIQPTANCQLGCDYCGQVHSKDNMTDSIVDKTVERIKHNLELKNYEALDITWYGGEPLLGYSSIKKISTQLLAIAREKRIGYKCHMITNGLSLKPKIFEELYFKYHVNSFQITIDTTKENHDKRRITKEGKSTFDIIMRNIINITKEDYYKEIEGRPILIRLNIDITNYESVVPFIDYLVENELQNKVNINFSSIVNWGQETAGDDFALSKEQFAALEIEWYLYALNKGFSLGYFLPQREYSACMVVMDDAEVYDAFGNILPCYEFSYTPYYDSQDYIIGNLFEPKETYNKDLEIKNWYDILESGERSTCKGCNLLPVCGGACPKKWLRGEVGCPEFKLNMEDRLVLQYLMDKSNITELL